MKTYELREIKSEDVYLAVVLDIDYDLAKLINEFNQINKKGVSLIIDRAFVCGLDSYNRFVKVNVKNSKLDVKNAEICTPSEEVKETSLEIMRNSPKYVKNSILTSTQKEDLLNNKIEEEIDL